VKEDSAALTNSVLALIEVAERAGTRHFIYTSYSTNVREDSPLETAKRACEKRLLTSKMRVTILRPSYFSEVWLSPALGVDPANARARIYGPGDANVSYISLNDVRICFGRRRKTTGLCGCPRAGRA
jgi:uncharacterized protein YbjT (DUF2867 family)